MIAYNLLGLFNFALHDDDLAAPISPAGEREAHARSRENRVVAIFIAWRGGARSTRARTLKTQYVVI